MFLNVRNSIILLLIFQSQKGLTFASVRLARDSAFQPIEFCNIPSQRVEVIDPIDSVRPSFVDVTGLDNIIDFSGIQESTRSLPVVLDTQCQANGQEVTDVRLLQEQRMKLLRAVRTGLVQGIQARGAYSLAQEIQSKIEKLQWSEGCAVLMQRKQ